MTERSTSGYLDATYTNIDTLADKTSLQNLILAFAGVVTAVTAYSIWNGDLFPKLTEPTGDPEKWSDADMRRWLKNVSACPFIYLPIRLSITDIIHRGISCPALPRERS